MTPCSENGVGERLPTAEVPSRHDVLEHAQIGKEADVLERAGDAEARDLAWLASIDASAFEEHLALGRVVDTGQQVEDRRLSGAVGTDESVQGAAFHFKVSALTAVKPPNRLVTARVSSSAAGIT